MDTITIERAATAIPMKRRLKFGLKRLALACLALAVTLGGIAYGRYWWTVGRFIESTDDAYAGGNVTPVAPHVAGFVAQILVTDNQYVRAGQLLIHLDARDFQAALDHTQAIAEQRQAALAAKYVLQQSMIRQDEADLNAKAAHATFANEDAVRYRNRAATTLGTRQNAERASATGEEARSATKAAEAGLAAARQQLSVLSADIAAARADVAQAKADLETARLNLGYTEICSPIDGYVGNRAAQVGRLRRQRRLPFERHSGARSLGRCQFQGGSAGGYAAGTASDDSGRCATGKNLPRSCREPGARDRSALQRDPAGKRHRQLHEDRSARTGPHRAR